MLNIKHMFYVTCRETGRVVIAFPSQFQEKLAAHMDCFQLEASW